MRRSLLVGLVAALQFACVTAGQKPFKEAERLRGEGKLGDARRAYQDALSQEPGNKTYQARLESLGEQIELEVERLRSQAKEKEKASDWTGASSTYAQALDLKPKDADLEARKALTAGKSKNLDPDGWFSELEKILASLPGNQLVERSLAGARAGAYQYHLALGAKLVDAGDGPSALEHFDRAKAIDPATPGWNAEQYGRAQAMNLAAQAELRLIAGDAVEAHEMLSQAAELWPNPDIKKRLAEAKGRASAILKKLESARALSEKKRWAEALRAYEELGGMKGVPASASTEAATVRGELAKSAGADALAAAKKGDGKRAKAAILDALKYAELGAGPTEGAKLAADLALAGEPAKAKTTLDSAGLTDANVLGALEALVQSAARANLAKAQKIAKKDAAGALAILAELEVFAAGMPEIAALKQSLRKDAFQGLLDDALAKARAGDDKGAADLVLAALRASKAPANVAGPVEKGAAALASSSYADAEREFQAALAAAAKSVLAQRGLDIVRIRMAAGEKDALEVVRAGSGDVGAAVSALEAVRIAKPGNASAAEAAKILVARLGSGASGLDDLALARDIGYAARLSELPAAARSALEAGNAALAQGDHGAAEQKYKQAEVAAPDAKLAAIAREAARGRMMTALKSGAKAAAKGDESSAAALRKLLEADPKNAEALAALDGIHESARAAAKGGDFAGAARFLGVALAATAPAPGVKAALEKGNAALAAGDLAGAEAAYGDATDLEASNVTGKTGYDIAKTARVENLKRSVAEAKTGANTEQAAAALQKTLEVDPNSTEAREAFKELIATAKARGDEGKDREAAQLLDAANTVSKPETAKKAIAAANAQLGEGKHAEAEAAYDKLLASAESQVARAGKDIAHARRLAVLMAGVEQLKNGGDLERGAKAVKDLLALEATNAEALAAIDAALQRAEAAAERGDEKAAAAELRAADQASGSVSGMPKAIADLERGRFDDAEGGFGRLSGPVATRGVGIAKKRKLATLRAGMSGADDQKAAAIKAMLAQDPNNKDAKAELGKLFDRARASAKKGDDADAAKALEIATQATGAPEELAGPLNIAGTHLAEGRYAEAERNYGLALEINRASPVAEAGQAIARDKRRDAERAAVAAINKGEDPLKHAQVLQATLIVEPKAKSVSEAFGKLMARAKAAATKGNVVDTARTLDAAAMLEGLPAPMVQKITEANAALAASKFGEAESAYSAALTGEEARASQVAEIGKGLARTRRLAELRADLAAAQKEKDLLRARQRVTEILALDPADKQAKALAPKLGGDVAEDRFQAAMTQKGYGKLGVAHLYLSRALAADAGHAKAQAELAALEKSLSEGLDLVVRVSDVQRKGGTGCADLEAGLREALMKSGSERTDLGLFILGASWTEKVDKNAADAPKVGASLDVVIATCANNSATGSAKLEWKLRVPPREGKVVAEGTTLAEVTPGMVLRDEQDAAGKNVRAMLSKKGAAALLTAVEGAREKVEDWLLVRGEVALEKKDVAAVADVVAQLKLKKGRAPDADRVKVLEAYLDGELK